MSHSLIHTVEQGTGAHAITGCDQWLQPNKTSGLPAQPTKQDQWATRAANSSTIHRSVSNTHSIHNIVCTSVPQIASHRHTYSCSVSACQVHTYTHSHTCTYTHTHTHMCIRYEGELCTYSKFRHTYIQTHVCAVNEQKLNTHIWTAASHSKLTTLQGALHRKQLSLIQDREYMRTYVRVYACPGLPRQQVKLPTKMSVSQW